MRKGHPSGLSQFIVVVVACLLAAACRSREGPENAQGSTPVRYVVCKIGGTSCFVQARFRTLEDCESARQLLDAACDRVSEPGRIICDERLPSLSAESYCTA